MTGPSGIRAREQSLVLHSPSERRGCCFAFCTMESKSRTVASRPAGFGDTVDVYLSVSVKIGVGVRGGYPLYDSM